MTKKLNIEQELEDFAYWMDLHGRAKSTIRNKSINLRLLMRNVQPFNQENVQEYLYEEHKKGKSGKYLNTILGTLSLYHQSKGLEKVTVKFFKEKETYRAILTNEEILRILNVPAPRNGAKEKARWYQYTLFFKILAYTGMRPGEAAKLTKGDIEFNDRIIILRETKTGRFRVVPINPSLYEDLKSYTEKINTYNLFPAPRRGAEGIIRNTDWCCNFKKRTRKLGIEKPNLSVYSLRFTFITRLLSDDVNLFKVQRIVGHQRVEQTAHYTRYVSSDLFKAIEKDSL